MAEVGIGENKVFLGRNTILEEVYVNYGIDETDICLVKNVALTKRAKESSFLKFKGQDSKCSVVSEFLLVLIERYKPKKIVIGSLGYGIEVWDYILPKLIKAGTYIAHDGNTSYNLSQSDILTLVKKENNTLYDRCYIKSEDKVKKLLELSYENKVLIKLTDDDLRGMGKTTALLRLADKEKLSIITTNLQQYSMLALKREQLGLEVRENIIYIGNLDGLDGKRMPYPNFMIDEGVDMTIIKGVINMGFGNLVGGWEKM